MPSSRCRSSPQPAAATTTSSDSGTVAEGTEASTAETTADTTADTTAGTTADTTEDTTAEATGGSTAPAGDGVRLGIMAECEGAFGGFNEDVVAGATLALINEAGATSKSPDTALDGFTGAEVGGIPIELVGIGCGDDTPDRAVQEIRTLVEQDGANVVIGPLSGDEGIAIANYALDHPDVTFIDGISGAQDATLHVQAPNFFRYHGDGAQWNAGLGYTVHNDAGWDTVAVIADDYGFGWTSAAGFVADFCAAGGDVVTEVFPPLGTTDYSSFIQQLPNPDEVDGYFWAVGGTGTNASLEAFLNAKGDLTGDQHAGNLFFSPALAEALGTDIAGAYVGGFASLPGDITTPEITEYLASADAAWDTLAGGTSGNEPAPPSQAMGFGFGYGYYVAGTALVQALTETGSDRPRSAAGRARRSRSSTCRTAPSRSTRTAKASSTPSSLSSSSTRRRARSSSRRSTSCPVSTRPSAAPTRARRTRPNGTTHPARRRNSRGRAI